LPGIFLSYRRDDAAGWTGRLADDLRRELPGHHVFYDLASIEIGEDFVDAMRRSLADCAVVLVMIGRNWLNTKDDAGNRRLDDPEDWVRIEVAEALHRQGLRVVPVLVGGASMPRAADLPEPVKPLARRNAHEISDRRWEYDVTQLVAALKKIPSLSGATTLAVPAPAPGIPEKTLPAERTAGSPVELPPGTFFRDGDDCPEMVVIPAGEFMMGEGTQHKVTIARPFAVGKYPVTFDEWDACVNAGGTKYEPVDSGWGRGKRPVINVSWDDAQAYVAWLSKKTGMPYRLLSEAEWEYAARAGTTTRYPWGDEPDTNHANFRDSGSQWSGKQTSPVGSFEPNAFGLYDMIGNVWEWAQDCWNDSYKGAPSDGSAWESGNCGRRVVRGGSWGDLPEYVRVAYRSRVAPSNRNYIQGFRLARTV
jgi:formylglycine-generating enzyme required for sulfatase activity